MKATMAGLGSLVLLASLGGTALAQEQIAPPYQDAPVAMQAPPVQAAPLPPEGAAYAPAYPYVTFAAGVPYPYPYAPAYGYASPWGVGRYRYGYYGARFGYPGRAVGWRGGWGGHPHVGAHVGGGHPGVGRAGGGHPGGGHFGGGHGRR